MGRGTSKNVKVISQVFTLNNVNIRHLCLFQIKCAIMRCIFDFFYALKEKHCRSPPTNQFTKTNWLEEREMQDNAKCFIKLKKGIYEEITYKELKEKRKKYSTYKKKKFIKLDDILLEVSKKDYEIIEYEEQRQKYLDRVARKMNLISYDHESENGVALKNIISNPIDNIEATFERKIEIEKLRIALLQLTEEEYKLIKALFFENKTLREYAAIVGKHYTTIQDKRDRILEKLKKFIKI